MSQCPQVGPHIDVAEVSTPLTTRHFAGHPQGEIYGIAGDSGRFEARWLRPRTDLPGLWLTGSDVCSPGVAGAAFGGLLCATAISAKNYLWRLSRTPYEPKIVA